MVFFSVRKKGNKTMKRFCRAVGLGILSALLILACNRLRMRTVSLEEYGTICVPTDWKVQYEGGAINFFNEKQDAVMRQLLPQTISIGTQSESEGTQFIIINDVGVEESVVLLDIVSGEIYSNSAWLGKARVKYEGLEQEIGMLELYGKNETVTFLFDTNISEHIQARVAKSYKRSFSN